MNVGIRTARRLKRNWSMARLLSYVCEKSLAN